MRFSREVTDYIADDVVFHVASSMLKALRYIKKASVNSYSWWEVQEQTVDSARDPHHVDGRRGGKLKQQPFAKAVALFKKCKTDPGLGKTDELPAGWHDPG